MVASFISADFLPISFVSRQLQPNGFLNDTKFVTQAYSTNIKVELVD